MTASGVVLYGGFWGQDLTPPSAVTDLSASSGPAINDITITWTAPFSDGDVGDITSGYYRIKIATYAAYDFPPTSYTVSVSTSMTQGELQTFVAGNLTMNVTYYVRVRHCDENYNWSGVSVGATVYLEDVPVPPHAPSSLSQSVGEPPAALDWDSWISTKSVRAAFTQGDSNSLDLLRFSVDFSSHSDFSFIFHSTTSIYLPHGATNYLSAELTDAASWHWRARSQDDSVGNYLGAYSTAAAGGAAFRIDTLPPSAISNLTALTGALDGDVILKWSAPSDDGASEPLIGAVYVIKAATYNITSDLYDTVTDNPPYTRVVEVSTSAAVGVPQELVIRGILYPGTTWYFAIRTRDKAGNFSSWTTAGVNAENSASAEDLPPAAPPGVTASPAGSTTIDVSWDLPSFGGYDDRDIYWIYRATFSFASETAANVLHIATRTHPYSSYTDSGLTSAVTYYYRLKTLDKGDGGNGLFSAVYVSPLSVIASTVPAVSQSMKVTVVYDDRSEINKNNYGVVDGIEDADGSVSFIWPKVIGGGFITNYFVRVSSSSDINTAFYFSSATLPSAVSTYTVSGLPRGVRWYCRVKAKNTDEDESPWTISDGIYVSRKTIDSSISDWGSTYATVVNSVTVWTGDALWRDAISDQRTDRDTSSQLDISSVGVTCDEYNLYLFVAFASTVSAGFDGRNFIQIMLDNGLTSTERVFRGRGVGAEDSYVSGDTAWEWLCEVVTGNDEFRVEDSLFSNRKFGRYSEHNGNYLYEVAMPLSNLGGKEKFLGKTVNFTVATFWNDNGGIGQWGADSSNIVDVVTSSGPNTWNEVPDRVVDYYLAVKFSTAGVVTAANGITAPAVPPMTEPQPDASAPPSALDYMLYNIFVDAWRDGDPTNNNPTDTNSYGGDFQGVMDSADYFNEMGINMLWFAPVHQFGGGIWGYNLDDAYQFMSRFGGRDKYVEMAKKVKNHNLKTMLDWVPGQVGGKGSPTGKKYPQYFQDEIFGYGLRQEFAEPRAYMVNNAVWWSSFTDGFRFDNPKFWDNGDGPGRYEFCRALRFVLDRWDPELYTMGEIPGTVGNFNEYTGSLGPMIHGAIDMASGGYKDAWDHHICAWARPGDANSRTTIGVRSGLDEQQITWKNSLSINPVMMENHDEHRLISRYRPGGVNGEWQQRVAYMTAFLVGGPAKIFYGGEVGLEGPYGGGSSEKMDRDGNVRQMLFNRANEWPWSAVRDSIRRTLQAKANFPELRGDPKKGGRGWYTGGQYDGDVLVVARTWANPDRKSIVMLNRSASDVTLTSVGTGDNNTLYKDWLTDTEFWTDGSGNIASILVPSHDGRILIRGGYDWVNITGSVKDGAGNPIPGAVVDIDRKSHWTTTADANGNYSLSGNLRKVLTGNRAIRAWANGFNIVEVSTNIAISGGVDRVQNFTLTADNAPPQPPTNLSGRPRKNAAMLFWQPNTEGDIQSYIVYRSTRAIADGSFPVALVEVFSGYYYDNNFDGRINSDGQHADLLENGATYYYRVRSVDRSGNKSALSNQITIIPRALKTTFWVDTRDSGLSVASVDIEGDALAFGDTKPQRDVRGWTQLYSNGDGTFQRTFEMDDSDFIEYKYVITTSVGGRIGEGDAGHLFNDPAGTSGAENRGEIYLDAIPNVEIRDEGDGTMLLPNVWRWYQDRAPRAPSGVGISAGPNILTIGWTKNAEPDLNYYSVYRSTWSPTFQGAVSWVDVGKDKISYVDTNLLDGNTYYYRIRAIDRRLNVGDWSSTVWAYPRAADTTAPVAPTGLVACGSGTNGLGAIEIKWNANFEGDLAGYNIHRSTESEFTPVAANKLNIVLISPSQEPLYTDENITTGTQCYYKIVAIDDSGNTSNPSAQLPAKIVPVTLNVDIGNINPSNVQIFGNTKPLDWSGTNNLTCPAASTYTITLGFISGATIWYRYGYNSVSVEEQPFATSSQYREYVVPHSSAAVYNDWEQNPDMVSGVKVYGGVNKAYLYWDANTTAEDLAGYNIYRSTESGFTPTATNKVNADPVSYSQPYTATGLAVGSTYYFSVKAVDSGSQVLESTAAAVVPVFISSSVYVHFGIPFSAEQSSAPWGDAAKIKIYLAVHNSTDTDLSVWNTSERANVTNGQMEMTASGDGTYRAMVPLAVGNRYNFTFFARTTNNPPSGLNSNAEYYDTVPDTGSFIVSNSSTGISAPEGVSAVFAPFGITRDARRVLVLPSNLAGGSTMYVFANFGSTPTAPTYIQAVGGNNKVTLYWSAPYGSPWTYPSPEKTGNVPLGGGESIKAADVIAGGVYHIFVTTYNHGSFASYAASVTISGGTMNYTFTGLQNGVTYYYLMRSSDTFSGLVGNNFSVLSATVSAIPTSASVPVSVRVNRGAAGLWKSVRKTIAFQEGITVSAWDTDGKSNITPTGRAINMTTPSDDASEQEFLANLTPGASYNFMLFAYSTFSISGLETNATYYDTVPSAGSGGMVTSTSTVSITGHGKAWCGPVGPGFDARRILYVPTNLPSGATLYVYCNFASSPSASYVSATVVSTFSVHLEWTPYGAWGTSGESLKAADVIAGGHYYVWRSSVSSSGPWNLWVSTSSRNWIDADLNAPGDALGLEAGRTYYYVVVSSDSYSGDFIPNMRRAGAPEFSSSDASATPREKAPVYFKVENIFFDERYVLAIKMETGIK